MRAGMLKVRGLYLYKASPGDAPLALRVENLNREWVGFWPSGACAGPVGRLDGEFSGPLRMGDAETLQRVREVLGERPALSAPGKVPPGWVSEQGLVLVPPDIRAALGLANGGGVVWVWRKDTGHVEMLTNEQYLALFESD